MIIEALIFLSLTVFSPLPVTEALSEVIFILSHANTSDEIITVFFLTLKPHQSPNFSFLHLNTYLTKLFYLKKHQKNCYQQHLSEYHSYHALHLQKYHMNRTLKENDTKFLPASLHYKQRIK